MQYMHARESQRGGMAEEQRALLFAGAVGGPFTIGLYTPLRNAITLGAGDAAASAGALYATVLRTGPYTGWLSPTVFSCAQFLALGPLYHIYAGAVGPTLAVVPTACTESLISFGSQTRNAQMAFNAAVGATERLPLQAPWDPRGVAFAPHVARNACAMSGFRVLSGPMQHALDGAAAAAHLPLDRATANVAADFLASIISAAVSMPFNQLFNYLATTTAASRPAGVLTACAGFLRSQYLVRTPSGRLGLSRTIVRDAFMRCAYIAPQLSTYSAIERLCVSSASSAGLSSKP